jgi:predicted metalloprotease with PDZ domain
MHNPPALLVSLVVVASALLGPPSAAGSTGASEPIRYTIKVPSPADHVAEVEATLPTGSRPSIAIMMAVWSPGFYRVEDYAKRVEGLTARASGGTALAVEPISPNRWKIDTGGAPEVVVSYRLSCRQSSVTTNYVGDDLAVFNPAATFVTLVEPARRPHEVRLELSPKWKRSITALDRAPDGLPDHYRAADYDTLVDSPIVAGNPSVHEFDVAGSRHLLVDLGDSGPWDGAKAAEDLKRIVEETRRFWGFLPFQTYYFLNVFRRGGGGLEHKNSTLLTAFPPRRESAERDLRWLDFVSHEYFHAFNVKRLRPVELGPFDYEHPPRTASLWVAEGLTSYCGLLIVTRSGLGTPQDFLSSLSGQINDLQNSPGRLLQSLEQSSLDVWSGGTSGVGRDRATTVSYYVKGPIVGFLLDAKIRRASSGKQSLDDLMRLAYKRYAGERGFTPEQFRLTAEDVAGTDLKDWFRKAISSTEELDYAEALDWFGLRFAPSEPPVAKPSEEARKESPQEPAGKAARVKAAQSDEEPAKQPAKVAAKKWKLEIRDDRTESQTDHLRRLFNPSGRRP